MISILKPIKSNNYTRFTPIIYHRSNQFDDKYNINIKNLSSYNTKLLNGNMMDANTGLIDKNNNIDATDMKDMNMKNKFIEKNNLMYKMLTKGNTGNTGNTGNYKYELDLIFLTSNFNYNNKNEFDRVIKELSQRFKN